MHINQLRRRLADKRAEAYDAYVGAARWRSFPVVLRWHYTHPSGQSFVHYSSASRQRRADQKVLARVN